MNIVNLSIMKHPLNWLTLALWVFGIGYFAVVSGLATPPPKSTLQTKG